MEYHSGGSLPLLGRPRYCAGSSANANGGYLCESGHCCGESGCCTYYYELWWFWLLWTVLIVFSCCCAYRHRRAKQRVQQQQRQREIGLLAYHGAPAFTSSMLDLSFLASLKLPSYEEVAAQPSTPPPPYSAVFTAPRYPQPPPTPDPHLLTQHGALLHRQLSDGPSSLSSDNSSSCSCDSCCPSSPCSSSLSAPLTYDTETSHASTPSETTPLTLEDGVCTVDAAVSGLDVTDVDPTVLQTVTVDGVTIATVAPPPAVEVLTVAPPPAVEVLSVAPPPAAAVLTVAPPPAAVVLTVAPPPAAAVLTVAPPPAAVVLTVAPPPAAEVLTLAPPPAAVVLTLAPPPAAEVLTLAPPPAAEVLTLAPPPAAAVLTLAPGSGSRSGSGSGSDRPDGCSSSEGRTLLLDLCAPPTSDPSPVLEPIPSYCEGPNRAPDPPEPLPWTRAPDPPEPLPWTRAPDPPEPLPWTRAPDQSVVPDLQPNAATTPPALTPPPSDPNPEPSPESSLDWVGPVTSDLHSDGSGFQSLDLLVPSITIDPGSAPLPSPPVIAPPPQHALLLDPLTASGPSPPGPAPSQSPPKQTLFSPCVDVFEAAPSSWDEDEDVGADESQYRHRRLTGDSGIEVCRCRVEDEDGEDGGEEDRGGADLHDRLDCPVRTNMSNQGRDLCSAAASPTSDGGGEVGVVMETV